MEDVKAIETFYNGYRFRSRLEARWAVFFDTAGIKYEYETEGFKKGNIFYLPDFYLPDEEMYVEVKPKRPGCAEGIRKAASFVGSTIERLLILSDIPNNSHFFYGFPVLYYNTLRKSVCYEHVFADVAGDANEKKIKFTTYFSWGVSSIGRALENDAMCKILLLREVCEEDAEEAYKDFLTDFDLFLKNCYSKARMARFEFGETPKGRR